MLIKPNIDSTVGESMVFPSLDLKPADLGLPLALQRVSCYHPWFLFKLTDQTSLTLQPVSGSYPCFQIELTDQNSWPCRECVIVVPGTLSSLLTEHYLALCRKWVAVAPDTLSNLLTKLIPGFAGSELLMSLHPFKPADKAHPWLCREWVAAIPGTLLSLLTKCILGSADCESLLTLASFQACWPSPPFALQSVSCCWPWHTFKLANLVHPWLCRMSVAADPDTLSILLNKFTLGTTGSELLLSLAPFQAC